MKINMYNWLNEIKAEKNKKPLPILSFPGIKLIGADIEGLINSSDILVKCIKAIADKYDTAAGLSPMDLSVEAQAFGANIKVLDGEVPTVTGRLIDTEEEAVALKVPKVGEGRTGVNISAVKKAAYIITDRPILAGVIGPFSLAGRLMEMTEVMIKCYTEPETVHIVLKKATEFITSYITAFKEAGANGVIMAEPAAGLLSPELNDEFSTKYIRQIIEKTQDENFIVIYHNCGNTIPLIDSILTNGARAYHFGNAIKISEMLKIVPKDIVVMGNVSPAEQFLNGTPQSIYNDTTDILKECGGYDNFVISSGCDIPPLTPWENIDSFFKAVKDYYIAK